ADARDYLRALKSRNLLLKMHAPQSEREAFDEPLAKLGARIRMRRESVLAELRGPAVKAFAEVARGEAPLSLDYLAAGRDSDGLGEEFPDEQALAQALKQALARRAPRDEERGYTSVGPHADDLAIAIGEKPARLFASQGQSRAVVLAFKIGEIENLRRA